MEVGCELTIVQAACVYANRGALIGDDKQSNYTKRAVSRKYGSRGGRCYDFRKAHVPGTRTTAKDKVAVTKAFRINRTDWPFANYSAKMVVLSFLFQKPPTSCRSLYPFNVHRCYIAVYEVAFWFLFWWFNRHQQRPLMINRSTISGQSVSVVLRENGGRATWHRAVPLEIRNMCFNVATARRHASPHAARLNLSCNMNDSRHTL